MKDGEDHPKFREVFSELGDLSPEEWIDAKAKIKNKLVDLEDMDITGNAPKRQNRKNNSKGSWISRLWFKES